MKTWFTRVRNSLFTRIFLTFVLAVVALNLLLGFAFHLLREDDQRRSPRRHLAHYAQYVIADIGQPPNPQKANELAKKLDIQIRFDGPELSFSTHDWIPPMEQMDLRQAEFDKNVYFSHARFQFFLVVKTPAGNWVFGSHQHSDHFIWGVLVVLLVVSLVVTGVFWVIQRMLRPVRQMNQGIQQVIDGNLEHKVPVGIQDELGRLAALFNQMTERVQSMLKAKEQLLLDVSHELRSPLTRIKVALEFLPPDQAQNQPVESIRDDVQQLEAMVTEILETARMSSEHGSLKKNTLDLKSLLHQCADRFQGQAPHIELELPEVAVSIQGDVQRLDRVFNNLLENAFKYSTESNKPIKMRLKPDSTHCEVLIQDFGVGIARDELEHLFEPFYRTDKSRSRKTGGYGLGLSLCKKIIEAHDGSLEISSEVNQGTLVRILLPNN